MKLKDFYKRDYGSFNTHDLWKFLAIIFMIIDHFGLYFFYDDWYRVIGRLSFPIFAVIYGYHFKNKLNFSLLLYGLPIVFLNFCFGMHPYFLNILYSFFICSFLYLIYSEATKTEYDKIIFIAIVCILHTIFDNVFEYGSFAFLFILIAKLKGNYKKISFILVFLFYLISQVLNFSFKTFDIVVLTILLTIVGYFLYYYSLKEIKINKKLTKIPMFIARYSLELYVIQACLFRIIFFYKYSI